MYRRIFIVLLLVMNIFVLSGCWDRHELEDFGIINGIGIEEGREGKIKIVIQTLNVGALAKGAGGKAVEFEKAYRNTVLEGDSVYEALSKYSTITSTERHLSHNSLYIVSEEFARERGVQDLLDYFEREPETRKDAWFIIGRGSLVNLLDVPGRLTTTPAQRISDIIKSRDESFSYAPLRLEEFIRVLQSDSSEPYTAVVEHQDNASYTTEQGHGILDGNVPEPLYNTVLNGTAVFKKDRMMGWLDQYESQGLLWLRGDVKGGGTIIFSIPEKEGKKVVTTILDAKGKLEPEIKDGQIYITAKIEVKSFLEDNQAGIKIDQPEEVEKLEAAQGEEVKRQIEAALQKAQHLYNVDVFGFGEAVHRKYPGEWKELKRQWPEFFPDVQVDVQVQSLIEHTATTGNAPKLGEE